MDRFDQLAGLEHTGADHLAVEQDRPAVDLHDGSLGNGRHDVRPEAVDQSDAGVEQHHGALVGIPAGTTRGGVEHGDHTSIDQGLRRNPIEILVIDDGDVATLDALAEVLRASVGPCRAADHRRRRRSWVATEERSEPCHRVPRSAPAAARSSSRCSRRVGVGRSGHHP